MVQTCRLCGGSFGDLVGVGIVCEKPGRMMVAVFLWTFPLYLLIKGRLTQYLALA